MQVQPRAEASNSTPLNCDPTTQLSTRSLPIAEGSNCERGHKRCRIDRSGVLRFRCANSLARIHARARLSMSAILPTGALILEENPPTGYLKQRHQPMPSLFNRLTNSGRRGMVEECRVCAPMTRELYPEHVRERGISTWPLARCICTAGEKKSAKPATRSCMAATLAQKPCGELAQNARALGVDGDVMDTVSPWTDWRHMAHQIRSTDLAAVVPDLRIHVRLPCRDGAQIVD